ncbi:hypothetical protein [Paucidesulfovibrio longus]|uniref:hypothetical protein n=1 Tax=Paucidesulfovibrio longus TaxID=889 RepID=UPI0003B66CFA|nr:hypothetical protein [Paucidesulfovibrio longus]
MKNPPALLRPGNAPRRAPKRPRLSTSLAFLLVALLASLLSGCLPKAPPEPLPLGPEWPAEVDPGRVAWQPRSMAGTEAARRALVDTAPLLRVPGRPESRVEVLFSTPRLLTFKLGWTEYEWRTPMIERWPVGLCMPFCEEEAGPPQRVAVRRESALVLPLDRVDDLRLHRVLAETPGGGQSEEWRVRVLHESGRTTELAAPDGKTQTLLADALFTLSRAFGGSTPSTARPLFTDLTRAQATILGVPGGALVLSWPLEPDAEGMRPAWPDVVLAVDGKPATAALLERRAAERGLSCLEVLRWGLYSGYPRLRSAVFALPCAEDAPTKAR